MADIYISNPGLWSGDPYKYILTAKPQPRTNCFAKKKKKIAVYFRKSMKNVQETVIDTK